MIEDRPSMFKKKYDPFYIYHIPGVKVGATNSLEHRVHKAQGYQPGEYEVLGTIPNIFLASFVEIAEQTKRGYQIETQPYYKLFKMSRTHATMNTTGFYCEDLNDMKAFINGSITLHTPSHGDLVFNTEDDIDWLISKLEPKQQRFADNKGIAPYFIRNKIANDYLNTRSLSSNPTIKVSGEDVGIDSWSFQKIRGWAYDKKLYGHPNSNITTQTLKLGEEFGELQHAVLKGKQEATKDAIGDLVVVLTSIAELNGHSIEEAISYAWNQIKDRQGPTNDKGDFIKDTDNLTDLS